MSPEAGSAQPLPKFGEWDVYNPASAESFTVIFNKARDQKKTNGLATGCKEEGAEKNHKSNKDHKPSHHHRKRCSCVSMELEGQNPQGVIEFSHGRVLCF